MKIPTAIEVIQSQDVQDYLKTSSPLNRDRIPASGGWPFLAIVGPGLEHITVVSITDVKTGKHYILEAPIKIHPHFQSLKGTPSGFIWIRDELEQFCNILEEYKLMPKEAIQIERKYVKKFCSRNIHIAHRYRQGLYDI